MAEAGESSVLTMVNLLAPIVEEDPEPIATALVFAVLRRYLPNLLADTTDPTVEEARKRQKTTT